MYFVMEKPPSQNKPETSIGTQMQTLGQNETFKEENGSGGKVVAVQKVTKASSDKLLVKFSDVSVYDFEYDNNKSSDSEMETTDSDDENHQSKKKKKRKRIENSDGINSSLIGKNKVGKENCENSAGSLIRMKSFRVTRVLAQIHSCYSISSAARKAWRQAIKRASKCFLERHSMQRTRLRKELPR